MLDSCGRAITYLRLSLTDACDLRCYYCKPKYLASSNMAPLSYVEIERIAGAAVALGVNKIRLTGGEALLRSDILEICQMLSGLDGLRELCLTTNGTKLINLAQPLRDSGVSRLNISLDSLDPARYQRLTGGGDLARVLAGLDAALAAGFSKLKLNVVLLPDISEEELSAFFAYTLHHPVDVRFIELMPIGAASSFQEDQFVTAAHVAARLQALGAETLTQEGVAARFRLPGALGDVGLIRPMSAHFCADCDRIRITSDGMLKPCLHSSDEISLRGLEDEALTAAIRTAILQKPVAHRMCEDGHSDSARGMHRIGG